jgi:hypothetical protein
MDKKEDAKKVESMPNYGEPVSWGHTVTPVPTKEVKPIPKQEPATRAVKKAFAVVEPKTPVFVDALRHLTEPQCPWCLKPLERIHIEFHFLSKGSEWMHGWKCDCAMNESKAG